MRVPFHIFNLLSLILPSRCHHVRALVLKHCGGDLGHNVTVCGGVRVYGCNLHLGDGVWVSPEVLFYSAPAARILVGDRCDIGPGACFITGTHEIGTSERRAGAGTSKPIKVGNGCWVGARAIILGGADIAAGCVIAAGAVVLPAQYPPNVLLAGVPATVRRDLSDEGAPARPPSLSDKRSEKEDI